MKKLLLLLSLLLFTTTLTAQKIRCSSADKQAVINKIRQIHELPEAGVGETVVAIGKTFLGTPYVAKTLENGTREALVINLQGLDCTTYVENVLAFALLLKNKADGFDAFAENLEKIRYKDGKLDGYASRLHYFSEWISNNEAKALLKNITADIGGQNRTKEINFMSTHRQLYPFLSDELNYRKILRSEQALNSQPICVLPQEEVAGMEHLIKTGDIIALTTSIPGLDITHTGIASREKNGRIHLLHASSSGAVEVTKLPLSEYLKGVKKNTGIMVARPL